MNQEKQVDGDGADRRDHLFVPVSMLVDYIPVDCRKARRAVLGPEMKVLEKRHVGDRVRGRLETVTESYSSVLAVDL